MLFKELVRSAFSVKLTEIVTVRATFFFFFNVLIQFAVFHGIHLQRVETAV